MFIPDVTVFVHPIDTNVHHVQPGWRWAVHVGGGGPGDLERCCHAGWCPNEPEALFEGESHGAVACRALRMCGVPAGYHVLRLDHDPVPAGGDTVSVLSVTD